MTSAFPRPSSPGQQPKEVHHPMAISCLQWDCDGALNDQDREWMLQALAAQDAASLARISRKQSHRS
jgi:hypothetical protein